MDRINNARVTQTQTAEPKKTEAQRPAENPMDSLRPRSADHVRQASGDDATKNIRTNEFKGPPANFPDNQNGRILQAPKTASGTTSDLTLPAPLQSHANTDTSEPVLNPQLIDPNVTLKTAGSVTAHATTGSINNTSATTSTPNPATPVTTGHVTAAGTTATQVKFSPSRAIRFNQSIQDAFYNSLSPKALELVAKYNLTKTEAAAINAYTRDEYYGDMNAALRMLNKDGALDTSNADALKKAGIASDDLALLISATVSGMKKLPPTQTSNYTFRALGRNDSVPEEFLEAYKVGDKVTMPAFYSSTDAIDCVEQWWDRKDHALCLLQRANGNGRDVSAFSAFPTESEVLFVPGTQFMVIARTDLVQTPSGNKTLAKNGVKKAKILMYAQEISPLHPEPPSIKAAFSQKASASVQSPSPNTKKTGTKNSGAGGLETKVDYRGLL